MIPTKGNVPLPYAIEYAKSGRSTCKNCKQCIPENALRMSICEPSSFFDGNQDNWYHFACFWLKMARSRDAINISSIRGVDWLRWEDQELLREKLAKYRAGGSAITPEPRDEAILAFSSLKTEKSATNRGKCGKCSTNFERGEIKIQKKSKWMHSKCVFEDSNKILGKLDDIPGWEFYEETARCHVAEALEKWNLTHSSTQKPSEEPPEPASSQSIVENIEILGLEPQRPTSSLKREHEEGKVEEEDDFAKKRRVGREARLAEIRKAKMKKQCDRLWEYRTIFENIQTSDKMAILNENDQDIPEGHDPTAAVMDRLVDNALFGCPIGCPKCPNGKIVYQSARRTYVCTGYATEYSRCTYESKNPIRTPFKMPERLISKYKLRDVVFNEMSERLYMEEESEDVIVRNKRMSSKNNTGSGMMFAAEAFDHRNRVPMKLSEISGSNKHIIKNGTVIDAKFDYADRCHVYKDDVDGTLYQATLSLTDLTQNKNSFYKIQLLKDDNREVFYVFRSWGRVGTDVGGHLSENCGNKWTAISRFQELFLEKTQNQWKYRKHFRKMPGLFNYVETDFSEFEELNQDVLPGSKTKLPESVKTIVMSIFDVENMKSALKSFEMDINKMPLGRLSRNQINQAFAVLTELGDLLAEFPVNTSQIVDATNKFYTIIPHNFGMNIPEPIDSFHKVKEKNNMLNALLDIKFAYDQIYNGDKQSSIPMGVDPVDANYEKLRCNMKPVSPDSQDWKDIHEYMTNTQGSTHDVNVELVDILELDRVGEASKFKSELGNRMLLWHGSGKMNFAGILGQGLRIAPPEAPVSGYMFGKGVYFADMFTKSFFYCRAESKDEAYLLLCDVALGNSLSLMNAMTMSKATLAHGNNSVKGIGRECPDEKGTVVHPAGYVIPKGVRKTQLTGKHGVNYSLLYNEYIVYDVDQIQLKYLVRVKMHHARHR